MRAHALTWTVVAAALVALSCGSSGTDLLEATGGADGGSASTNPGATTFTDPFANAPAFSAGGRGGGDTAHNPGRSCNGSDCHGGSGGGDEEAPAFLIGGTIYKDYAGTVPAAGVEIRVTDTNGNSASTYSQSNGNFYIRAGSGGVGFPAVVGARDVSDTRPMITQLTSSAMGSCNQSGCHVPGGTPSSGAYYPVHIP